MDHQTHTRLKEVGVVIMALIVVFMAVALYSFHPTDTSFSIANNQPPANLGGIAGAYLSGFILSFTGFIGFLFPFILGYWVVKIYQFIKQSEQINWILVSLKILGFILILTAGTGLLAVIFEKTHTFLPQGPGGMIGQAIGLNLKSALGHTGSIIVLAALTLVSLTLMFGISWVNVSKYILKSLLFASVLIYQGISKSIQFIYSKIKNLLQKIPQKKSKPKSQPNTFFTQKEPELSISQNNSISDADTDTPPWTEADLAQDIPKNSDIESNFEPKLESVENTFSKASVQIVEAPKSSNEPMARNTQIAAPQKPTGKIPSIDLLDEPEPPQNPISQDDLDKMARLVEEKLADFSITAKVMGACPGPIVTRFELQLAPGMKVSKLSNISKDLARSLSAISVRVVEVIPGKSYVGVELPNPHREIVRLKEVLADKKFKSNDSVLYMGLGKDISGQAEFGDLGKMPHVLVAGTTGSGKSVGLNAMILSLLLRAKPEELRLIMIDPKMLELSVYEGIPHLLTPVVTDMNQAANALRWCVKEMDQRYKLMAALGVRNIAGLNQKIENAQKQGEPILDPLWDSENSPSDHDTAPELEKMPYIVVLVDEFADMMMVVGKKVEELIARLAQKARAAGIHLILATQRPSVDVITGLIKANVPSRMAFQVSSKIDSRTILDQQGAEQLLGYGDMLYLPPGTSVPIRVHGAFVADHEVHNVVGAWKQIAEPNYVDDILKTESIDGDGGSDGSGDSESDPLYDEAVQIVLQTQRASISAVQRKLKVGYNRAARLIEEMEAAGLVSEIQSNGMREVLVTPS